MYISKFLPTFQLLRDRGLPPLDAARLAEHAVAAGNTAALSWLLEQPEGQGLAASAELRRAAASAGHVPVLEALRAAGSEFDMSHATAAAESGHSVTLRWMAEGGAVAAGDAAAWSVVWQRAAAAGVDLATLRLLHEQRGAAVDVASAAAGGSVELVEWALLRDRGLPPLDAARLAEHAVAAGNTAALSWLLEQPEGQGLAASAELRRAAASAGHVPVLEALRAAGSEFDMSHATAAAESGHSVTLRWMAEGGAVAAGDAAAWSVVWQRAAAAGVDLATLRLLHEQRGAAVDVASAAAGGSVELVEWALLRDRGLPPLDAARLAEHAVAAGNTAALSWLLEQPEGQGLAASAELRRAAASAGHVPVLEALRAAGSEFDMSHATAAAESGHSVTLRWMAEGGAVAAGDAAAWSVVWQRAAAAGVDLATLRLLHEQRGAAVDVASAAAGGSVDEDEAPPAQIKCKK
ncbi:hypothetical protein HYH02_013277 [Chlamydomonas schloesseri]|uniref:Ankyrin repeat domain-containing protein n=1 Tax=Chlamydomonas schloesseri TaxID=2026947 RepID=A0A835T0F8_9CHLO|nr:hypothetical protein HYH02_013277 [Chlamydomonas schloesseri]|eukprot:KAG2431584.1 hypothetical protein HYH02_013277 [Chlamydomonas schloesseri]